MTLFVDTSVWSLAFRRDSLQEEHEVLRLRQALGGAEPVHATGLVLQELLQGFRGPSARAQIVDRFADIAMINPDRNDYIDAADLRNQCRSHGVQVGTIDALLAQVCVRHSLVMLSTDADFAHVARWTPLKLWVRT